MTALIAIETAVLALLILLVAGLLRSHAETLRRLHRLESATTSADAASDAPVDFRVHDEVPSPPSGREGFTSAVDVSGLGVNDDAVSIPVSGVGHATLLAFLSSGCTTCATFWDAFASSPLELPAGVRLVVVTQGDQNENRRAVAAIAPSDVATVMSDQAWADYDVPGSPYFVLVDGRVGRVRGEGTGASWNQVLRLIGDADDQLEPASDGSTERRLDDTSRAERIDRELLAAGIRPGDPSLYEPEERSDSDGSRRP